MSVSSRGLFAPNAQDFEAEWVVLNLSTSWEDFLPLVADSFSGLFGPNSQESGDGSIEDKLAELSVSTGREELFGPDTGTFGAELSSSMPDSSSGLFKLDLSTGWEGFVFPGSDAFWHKCAGWEGILPLAAAASSGFREESESKPFVLELSTGCQKGVLPGRANDVVERLFGTI